MKIVIIVESGCVQEVIADQEADVLIMDRDTDGVEMDELVTSEGEDIYVYTGITETDVDPDRTQKIYNETCR
jgi:hypothetical protein